MHDRLVYLGDCHATLLRQITVIGHPFTYSRRILLAQRNAQPLFRAINIGNAQLLTQNCSLLLQLGALCIDLLLQLGLLGPGFP